MTEAQLHALGPMRTAFLQPFERFFDSPKTIKTVSPLPLLQPRAALRLAPQDTAEPLAQAAGPPPGGCGLCNKPAPLSFGR